MENTKCRQDLYLGGQNSVSAGHEQTWLSFSVNYIFSIVKIS